MRHIDQIILNALLIASLALSLRCADEEVSDRVQVEGREQNAFDPSSTSAQTFTYNSSTGGTALAGASASFPAGSLSSEQGGQINVFMEPGSLDFHETVTSEISSQINIQVDQAATPVAIFPSGDVSVVSAFTISVPTPAGTKLRLNSLDKLTVFYQIFDPDKKEIRSGLKTSDLTASDDGKFLTFSTSYFGVFQAIKTKETIANDVEIKSNATTIKSSLDDSEIFSTKTEASNTQIPELTFKTSTSTITENGTNATITAILSAKATKDVVISFSYEGTATVNTDYEKKDSLTIYTGDLEGSVALSSKDDAIYEGDETIIISIVAVNANVPETNKQISLKLTDDESQPSVSLSCTPASIAENSNQKVTCTLNLSHLSANEVKVTSAYDQGTGTKDSDFAPDTNTLTITPGSQSTSWEIAMINDSNYEGNETMIVDVSSVVNGTESGNEQRQTITLTEDDNDPNTRILFTSYQGGDGNFYLMEPDGSNKTRISNFGGNTAINDMQASLAKDRSRLTYYIATGSWNVWTMNIDGTSATQITGGNTSRFPSLSPDGNTIVYGKYVSGYKLYRIDIDGQNDQKLNDVNANELYPDWSPDGSKLVYASQTEGVESSYQLYIINADGSNRTRITIDNGMAYSHPSWSDDGSKIVCDITYQNNGSTTNIYVMDADGSNLTKLTDTAYNSDPHWSPDGSSIVFVSNRDGNQEIYKMNADGSGVTRLTNNAVTDKSPTWE